MEFLKLFFTSLSFLVLFSSDFFRYSGQEISNNGVRQNVQEMEDIERNDE